MRDWLCSVQASGGAGTSRTSTVAGRQAGRQFARKW